MAIVGANEIYRKLSSQIESQFPEFIRDDGPNFVAFLKAYYEYMEQTGNAGDVVRGLIDYQDIDRTIDDFVEYFQREFMQNIPKNVIADKRLLTKHIREFYRARGSQESYRFLFRILFDKEIDFYYPGDDILRASDGRWVKETVIRGNLNSGNPDLMDGREITGQTSGATARVQEILRVVSLGIELFQFKVENTVGTFLDDEIVTDGFGNSIKVSNDVGALQSVIINYGGAFHQTGDDVSIAGSIGGVASGIISQTSGTSAVKFRIQSGGAGYRVGNTTISISDTGETIPAAFSIINLSNTEVITINQNNINSVKNVVLNTGSTFASLGSNSTTLRAAFAAANISSTLTSALTFANSTVGSINTIALLSPGYEYNSLPVVTVKDNDIVTAGITDTIRGGIKGENAIIVAEYAPGSITSIRINTTDNAFVRNDSLTITNLDTSSANTTDTSADTRPVNTRGLIRKGLFEPNVVTIVKGAYTLSGRYIDTKGFLSWNNKLQDNEYYQDFSYVIRVQETIDNYRNVIKKTVHPAGMKLFGMLQVDSTIDVSPYITVDSYPANTSSQVIIDFEDRITETLSLSDTNIGLAQFKPSVSESITASDSVTGILGFVTQISESVTASDSQSGIRYALWPNVQISVQVANNTVTPYSNTAITPYGYITVGALDGTERFVQSVVGISTFANGSLKATTGIISNTGAGSNLMIRTVGGPANNTLYQVNAIFSNTIFTLRTPYIPTTTNATFRYFTS